MKSIFTKTNVALALVLISGGVIAASSDWEAKSVDTTTAVSANPVAANAGIAGALNILNTAATTSTGSLVTQAVLTASGLANVHTAYLTAYQSTISAASHVANISEANALITAANTSAAPGSSAVFIDKSVAEDAAMTAYPSSMGSYFTGTGALTYTASGMPTGITFNGTSFSGTPTVPGSATSVTVTATDTANATANSSFNITVTNTNDAPVVASIAAASLAENAASGASVATATASDVDTGDTLSWGLSGSGSGNFVISSAGAITVASGASLDYETATSYTITVTATDGGSATDTTSLTVNMSNVDEGGPTIDAATPATYATTIVPGHTGTIHTFVATDPDGDSITYSTVTTGFSINASSGALTLSGATATTSVVVVATSTGGTDSHTISVPVQNAAAAIAGSDTVVASQLDGVLSAAVYTDLTTNNNCGSNGTTSCLAAFNAAKATTTCVLGGGASATSAQTATYVSCVMIESHTAVAAAISATQSATSLASASCDTSIVMPIPTTCSHSQWSCSISSGTTPSSGYAMASDNSSAILTHTYSGTPSTASYTVRASLGIYTPAYTRDYNYTISVPGTAPVATVNEYTASFDRAGFWNSCLSKGGIMATQQQVKTKKGWSNWPTTYNSGGISRLYYRNNASDDRTYNQQCSSSWSGTRLTMVALKPSGSPTISTINMRNHGSGTRLQYINASNNTANGNCRTSGGGTGTYFCDLNTYSCD